MPLRSIATKIATSYILENYNHLILNLYGAAQECTPAEFGEHALRLMKAVVHFDSAVLLKTEIKEGNQIVVHSMHLHNQPPEQLMSWSELTTPDHVLAAAMRRRGASAAYNSRDTFSAQPDFLDYCGRYDIAHTLIHIPPVRESDPNSVEVVSLWRAQASRDYSANDQALSQLLLPHLLQANQISLRLFADKAARPAQRVSALSSLPGCMHFAPPDAIALLQREWPKWLPPFLPPELLRQLVAEQRQYTGTHIVVTAELLGETLHLQIAPRPRVRLTGAEWNVARLAANGMSYKEIARQLGNSPATVRNQLHSVYAKLDVDNKTQLSARLPAIMGN